MNTLVKRRNQLALQNTGLVEKIAYKSSLTCRESYEDLFQIGYIGLLKACARFNANSGSSFSSFAVPYIQGEIQHYLRDQWQSVKIPRTVLETKANVKKLQKQLAQTGRELSLVEVAQGLGISKEQWQEMEGMGSNIAVSLDELLTEPIQDKDEDISPDEIFNLLSSLQGIQRVLIIDKFFKNKSDEDIAKKHKMSLQEAKAKIRIALAKIRSNLAA